MRPTMVERRVMSECMADPTQNYQNILILLIALGPQTIKVNYINTRTITTYFL